MQINISNDIICRGITEKDLDEIADIHIKSFKGYFLTELSKPLLRMYFWRYFEEKI